MNQGNDTPVRLNNGVVFYRPEERIREYCNIEVYRDIGYRGGYDDHHNITGVVTEDDLEAGNNLYANMSSRDRRRILGNPEIPSKLAAVRDAELGEVSDKEWEYIKSVVRPLLAEFLSIPNVKLVKTMKVLHLKRPHLFPILDSFVVKFLTGNDLGENLFSEEELLQIGITSFETARTDIATNRTAFHELETAFRPTNPIDGSSNLRHPLLDSGEVGQSREYQRATRHGRPFFGSRAKF